MFNKINLIFFLPNFSLGGAGNSIARLCSSLNQTNYNIFLISLGKNFYKDISLRIKKIFILLKLNQVRLFSLFSKLKKLSKILFLITKAKKQFFYLISIMQI